MRPLRRLEAIPILAEEFQKLLPKYFDNSLENIGRKNSVSHWKPSQAESEARP